MPDKERAILLWMLECPPEVEDEWNEWYDLEHFANLKQVPGFTSGNRYVRLHEEPLGAGAPAEPVPKYLTLYELEDRSVLESQAYFVHRTSSAPGMRPHWNRRMARLVIRVVGGPYYYLHPAASEGAETLWVLGFDAGAGGAEALDAWLEETLLPALRGSEGVLATRALGAFKDAPPVSSSNSRRGWSRMVLCTVPDAAAAARAGQRLAPVLSAGSDCHANAASITYERRSV